MGGGGADDSRSQAQGRDRGEEEEAGLEIRHSLDRSTLLRLDPFIVDKQPSVDRHAPRKKFGVNLVGENGRGGRHRSRVKKCS